MQTVLLISKEKDAFVLQKNVSQQFVVYGVQRDLIASVMKRANSLAEHWNKLFNISSLHSVKPIIIRLIDKFPSHQQKFETQLFVDHENRLKVQLDIFHLDKSYNFEFDERVFHALFLRNAYNRLPPPVGSPYHQPPHWIIDATLQNFLDTEKAEFVRPDLAVFGGTQNLDLKVFLVEKPETIDAASRRIYRMKARALLQSLLELPQGAEGMRTFLSNSRAWDGAISSFVNCFPELQRDATILTKTWKMHLERSLQKQKEVCPFQMSETAQRLNSILFILLPQRMKQLKNKRISGMEVIPLIALVPKYRYFLREKARDLLLLSFRAHPLYHALIDEYREMIEILLRHPRKDISKRIQAAEKMRESINKRCVDIEDYMNWFEAVYSTDTLNPFRSLLESDQRRRVPSWRSDTISRILDSVESAIN